MAANVSFALDNFDHEASRKSGERAMRRLNRMFGAISATNEAILRAKTEHDLYQRVCDAAVHSGKSFATVVLLAEPDSHWLEPVAGTGEAIDLVTQTRFSTDPANVYGGGICGEAFRTQRPCINSDIQICWLAVAGWPRNGVMACVALLLTKFGEHRVLMFFVGKSWRRIRNHRTVRANCGECSVASIVSSATTKRRCSGPAEATSDGCTRR